MCRPLRCTVLLSVLFAGLLQAAIGAVVQVSDDSGKVVTMTAPATRIISLAPHATELVFAAGAGSALIGRSDYSDSPAAALRVASIGGAGAIDIERIVQLKPDLIVAWRSGNSATQIARLRSLGLRVFESEPGNFEMVASSIERLARLAGTEAVGLVTARRFRDELRQLADAHRQRAAVRVFYQIWPDPLMTLNGSHISSEAIRLCGGVNIFAGLPQIAPVVSTEAVLQANPEVILSCDDTAKGTSIWYRFPSLLAVRQHNLLQIDASLLTRAGPRVLAGTEQLCRALDGARARRPLR